MADRKEFADLLYGTMINSTSSKENAFEKLSKIRGWLLANTPKRLFRFRSCSEHSIEALKEDQIWGTSIWGFNDPYECVPCYDLGTLWGKTTQPLESQNFFLLINGLKEGKIPPEIKRACQSINIGQMVKNILAQVSEKDVKEKLDMFKNYLYMFMGTSLEEMVDRFYANIQIEEAQKQMACFSEKNDSTLMWGHYADGHRGFCLEYDFRPILKECSRNCMDIRGCNNFMLNYSLAPIIYKEERFDATAYFSTVMQALLCERNQIPMEPYYEDILIVSKCLLTKSMDWEYESEWRLFTPNIDGVYRPHRKIASFRPVALYMGAAMSKENESMLYGICKNKGIECFKMVQDFHGKEFIVRAEPYEKNIDVVNGNSPDK